MKTICPMPWKNAINSAAVLAAAQVHVEVVDVEEDDATAIQGHRAFRIYGRCAACSGELALFVAAGCDPFERLNGSWLAVDA